MRIFVASILLSSVVAITSVFAATNAPNASASKSSTNATAAPTQATSDAVARVNGKVISQKELDIAVQAVIARYARGGRPIPAQQIPAVQHEILDDMISRELMLEEGQSHPPTNIDAEVKTQIDKMKAQMGGDEGLAAGLKEAGVTLEDYTRRMRDNIIIQNDMETVVASKITVSPEETKAYYDANREKMKQPEMIRASHILVRVSQEASDDIKKAKRAQIDAARSLIKSGEKFSDVARKVSEDPGSAANGGDLGQFGRGQMVPEFEQVAFSLKTNQLSDVVTTQFGYHLIMVTEHTPAKEESYDEVKADIEKFLKYRKSTDAARDHVKDLRAKAKVEILLPPLEPAFTPTDGVPSKQTPTVETPPVAAPAPVGK